MSSFVRTFVSSVLLIAAVAAALAGLSAQWLDQLARTPQPTQEIMAPLATDERVHAAIADAMSEAATQQFPALAEAFPDLEPRFKALVEQAIAETLSGEGVSAAWDESVDRSRESLVADLDAMRETGGDAPTVWLDLGPFAELAQERLLDITPEPFTGLVERIELPGDLRLALGRPDAEQAGLAADALHVAQWWGWFYAVAVVLAAVGLIVGSRRGRWLALIGASGLGVLTLIGARAAIGFVDAPAGNSVARAVGTTVWEGTSASLLAWTWPAVVAGWILVAAGVAGLVMTAVGRR